MDPGSAWANLTSQTRRTKGDVPPPLVGASVTTLGDAIYVFGGRPVTSREMISSLYRLNLRTLVWDRISPFPSPHSAEDEHDARPSPAPRYFHSAAAWDHRLVFYGGQGFVAPTSEEKEGHLETLDDVLLYDTVSGEWTAPSLITRPGVAAPQPRYAHLSVVTSTVSEPTPGFEQDSAIVSSRLTIIGGQNWDNQYIAEMSVLDLDRMEWIAEASFDRRAGTYRSVGVAPSVTVVPAVEAHAVGEPVVRSSYSIPISEEKGEPIMVFSNTNFVNPRRELDFIPSPVESLARPPYFSVADRMIGDAALPPGIRFPQAYACGRYLIVSGLNVATPISEYAIWSLDLGGSGASGAMENDVDLRWASIAAGNVLSSGSWNRAVGWKNNLVILGSKDRDILEDYNHRQNNFAHVAFVDLEAFGIYEPPAQQMTPAAQAMGLVTFSQDSLADFEVVSNEGERVRCSRKLLESRWRWFHDEMEQLESKARNATDSHSRTETLNDEDEDDEAVDPRRPQAFSRPASRNMFLSNSSQSDHHSPSPSISAHPTRSTFPISLRSLTLPLDAPAVRALVQYFYTLSLSTPLQRSVAVLTTLLMFTKTYDLIPGFRAAVTHALHESIDSENAPRIYESAALAGSVALQVSALRSMMAVRRPSLAGSDTLPHPGQSLQSRRPSVQTMESDTKSSRLPYNPIRLSAQSGPDIDNGSPYLQPSSPSDYRYSPSPSPSSAPHSPLPLPPTSALPSPPTSGLPSPPISSYPSPPLHPTGRESVATTNSGNSLYSLSDVIAAIGPPKPSNAPRTFPGAPPPPPPTTSTPARVAEAWREGEERERLQRIENARLAAEAAADKAAKPLNSIPEHRSRTSSHQENDSASLRTTQSSDSGGNKSIVIPKAVVSNVAVKAKKGFFSSLTAMPTIHNAQGGTAQVPMGQAAPKKMYPAPQPRYAPPTPKYKDKVKDKKGGKNSSSSPSISGSEGSDASSILTVSTNAPSSNSPLTPPPLSSTTPSGGYSYSSTAPSHLSIPTKAPVHATAEERRSAKGSFGMRWG